jgi:2-methylisocitrate lyase-like PEP mutase family enzyme
MSPSSEETLRTRLARKPILVAPGVYDAFTALTATQAGFATLYVSGAAIAYTRLGRPDIGLVGMNEVAETIGLIRDRVAAHLIVDADTGYGNALNVVRTVRAFERAGASAIQLEDQDFPKRCGHLDGKALIPGRRDGRQDQGCARHPRLARHPRHRAHRRGCGRRLRTRIERAQRYAQAGADMLFVEAPKTPEELANVVKALDGKTPLMANMVEGGKTPAMAAAALEKIGFALVIFPGGIVRALGRMAADYYGSLAANGTTEPFRNQMLDFDGLNRVIGTPEMIALGQRYERSLPAGNDNKTGGK